MPAVVISTDSASLDNAILLDYLTSEVAHEEPEIGSTDPKIPIDNNYTDDELDFGMRRGSMYYEDEGDKSEKRDAIPTARRRRRPATELQRFMLGTSAVDGCEGEDHDDADVYEDEEEEASQTDDGSTQTVEH